ARADDALGISGEYRLEKLGERAAPARGAMILGELDERFQKIRVPLAARALHRCICIHDHHSFVRARFDPYAWRGLFHLSQSGPAVLRTPFPTNAPNGAALTPPAEMARVAT